MPRKGWGTTALRDEYLDQLRKLAEQDHRSVSAELEHLLIENKILFSISKEARKKQ